MLKAEVFLLLGSVDHRGWGLQLVLVRTTAKDLEHCARQGVVSSRWLFQRWTEKYRETLYETTKLSVNHWNFEFLWRKIHVCFKLRVSVGSNYVLFTPSMPTLNCLSGINPGARAGISHPRWHHSSTVSEYKGRWWRPVLISSREVGGHWAQTHLWCWEQLKFLEAEMVAVSIAYIFVHLGCLSQ